MAADVYLMDRCQKEHTLFLRVYSWEQPSITIGFLQKADEILDSDALKRDGVTWIRRPTGGRAVLHSEDVTYSCIFSHGLTEMGTSIKETYSKISACLRTGLSYAGIYSETHDSESEFKELKREKKLPCFLAPNRDEIMIEGKKLVGSAQRRTVAGILQHGSIPISEAYLKLPEYLSISDEQRALQKRLLKMKTTCVSLINNAITYPILESAIVEGFKDTLKKEIAQDTWDYQERTDIKSVMNRLECMDNSTGVPIK
jgi:lipoate-protein ligase A